MPRRTNTFQQVVTIVQNHMAGDAVVEPSAMVTPTRGGPPREVDALITSEVAGHVVRVGVEASNTSRRATVEWVERMIGKHSDLPTDRVVLFSGSGFTAEALRKGQDQNLAMISAEDLSDADVATMVLGGLKAIWPKVLKVVPISAKVHVQRLDGSLVWFRAAPDVKLFLADGTELGDALRRAAEQVISQSLGDIARRIDLKAIEVSDETPAVLAFPIWYVSDATDGSDALIDIFVQHTDRRGEELHRVTAVEMSVSISVQVSRIDLTHARLGSVTVAYGELDGESLAGVFVVSRSESHAETATLLITTPSAYPPGEATERKLRSVAGGDAAWTEG